MTLKDVAKVAGVSPATVSYVLSGKKTMSPVVVKRVMDAVQVTKYKMNTAARALRVGGNKILGLMIPDMTNPFMPLLVQAIKAQAFLKDYAVILIDLSCGSASEMENLTFLQNRGVEGLIWIPGSSSVSLKDSQVPVVVLDYERDGFTCIHIDGFGGGRMQARHLFNKGHRSILLLSGPQIRKSAQERRRGFYEELKDKDVNIQDIECPDAFDLPQNLKDKILSMIGDISSIACGSGIIATGVMSLLLIEGVKIPDDISIIGFNDNVLTEYLNPPLTTISLPTEKISSLAVSVLLKSIENPSNNVESIMVPVYLNERQSVIERTV